MPLQNTGRTEIEVIETNPRHPNFGLTRWVAGPINTSTCPVIAQVGSDAISETVYRDDCTGSDVSTGVVYTLAANAYYAASKTQANQLARAAFDNSKAQYARDNAVCQGKSVAITSHTPKTKAVDVTLERSDTQGALVVNVFVQAEVDDGSGMYVGQWTRPLTILDGNKTVSGSISYGGGVLNSFQVVEILSTTPATYTF